MELETAGRFVARWLSKSTGHLIRPEFLCEDLLDGVALCKTLHHAGCSMVFQYDPCSRREAEQNVRLFLREVRVMQLLDTSRFPTYEDLRSKRKAVVVSFLEELADAIDGKLWRSKLSVEPENCISPTGLGFKLTSPLLLHSGKSKNESIEDCIRNSITTKESDLESLKSESDDESLKSESNDENLGDESDDEGLGDESQDESEKDEPERDLEEKRLKSGVVNEKEFSKATEPIKENEHSEKDSFRIDDESCSGESSRDSSSSETSIEELFTASDEDAPMKPPVYRLKNGTFVECDETENISFVMGIIGLSMLLSLLIVLVIILECLGIVRIGFAEAVGLVEAAKQPWFIF